MILPLLLPTTELSICYRSIRLTMSLRVLGAMTQRLGAMRSLQKHFATPALGTFQGHGPLQPFLKKMAQNTCNVVPARHASGPPVADPPVAGPRAATPARASFLGIFENRHMSVEDIEGKLTYPVKIIGTRKPFAFWFFEWDINVAFIRDFLNPRLYLTFQDSKGVIVGPVAYNASFMSWGLKVELPLGRNRIGYLGALKDMSLPAIPKNIDMGSGWDAGMSIGNIGLLLTTVEFNDNVLTKAQVASGTGLPTSTGFRVTYFGFGHALGMSRINSGGSYTRLPYLFTPSWNAKQWTFILLVNLFAYLILWLLPGALLLLSAADEEAEKHGEKVHFLDAFEKLEFAIGDEVEVRYDGVWYRAKIKNRKVLEGKDDGVFGVLLVPYWAPEQYTYEIAWTDKPRDTRGVIQPVSNIRHDWNAAGAWVHRREQGPAKKS